jgi:hypothetical protein
MTIQSDNEVKQTGDITYNAVVDMSGMVNMMNSLGTGSVDSTTPKDLCTDADAKKATLTEYYTDVTCTSLGDYKARMISTLPKENNPWIWVGSGVIVMNPLWVKGIKPQTQTTETDMDMKQYGVVIEGIFNFPYPIVYKEGWTRIDADSIALDMLDKNILNKRDLYIIARADGKKPTNAEILKYKKLIRSEVLKAKKSKKYDEFENIVGM